MRYATVKSVLLSLVIMVCAVPSGGEEASEISPPDLPVIDMTGDPTKIFLPRLPENNGSCYLFPGYVVIAWGSPGPAPVAIIRNNGPAGDTGSTVCSPDSIEGDFVIYNDWAETFCGMWRDLVFIDSGTSDIRSLIIYDAALRRQVMLLDGAGGIEGWIDDVTVKIWLLANTDGPRSLCPDIDEMFGVGVDSLYAFDLESFELKALGPYRCNQLQ